METRHRGNDDGDTFAALDFGDESGYDASGTGAVPDFGDESGQDSDEQRAIDALPEDTGDTQDAGAEDNDFPWELTTVTSPLETVSVTAVMDGRIHSVEVSAAASSMTESELAEEVLTIADLASRRASSVLHTLLLEGIKAQGVDVDGTVADLLGSRFLDLSSSEQATQAQADVFATRYPNDS